MRKSRLETARTRQAILGAATGVIRRSGLSEASLAHMMAAAGLSHGGFYRHFQNREQLIVEALAAAGQEMCTTLRGYAEADGLDGVVEGYLSESHRDATTRTCPLSALGSELARSSHDARRVATAVLEDVVAVLGDTSAIAKRRGEAIVTFATLVGALTLARIAANERLSREILTRTKEHLHARGTRRPGRRPARRPRTPRPVGP